MSTAAVGRAAVPAQRLAGQPLAGQRLVARRLATPTTTTPTTTARDALERHAWVDHVMGMPVSVHARGAGAREPAAALAVATLFDDLHALESVFSTYQPGSQLSRLHRGELRLPDADEEVREVHRLCQVARVLTDGAFDAWAGIFRRPGPVDRPGLVNRPGVFDPTGLVKGWAVARAARRLDALDHLAFAVGAGGDIVVSPGAEERAWIIGIEDPRDRRHILATVPVHDGAVATSGSAARGQHVIDPRSGLPATEVLSATVVGPSLLWADVFATAAVANGRDAVDWVETLHGTSGMLVLADGTIHRWQNSR